MSKNPASSEPVSLRFLGGLEVMRGGERVDLPRSRKTRALLAYLALSPRASRRSTLCNLFWERPDDPKGALRWSLSKIRPLLRGGSEDRIVTDGDFIHVDARDFAFDARELLDAARDPDTCPTAELERLARAGELLEGFRLPACADFELWLAEKREDVRHARLQILRTLFARHQSDPEAALDCARLAAELEPGDGELRRNLIAALDQAGRGEEANRQREIFKGVAPVRARPEPAMVEIVHAGGEPDEPAAPEPALALPELPSVAVLPFQKLGDQSDSEIIAMGLTHDVIMGLSRLRWLFVIARGTAYNVGASSGDVLEIAAQLGVRYITQGAIALAGNRLRVDVALIDATTRSEIWVERFNREVSELFAIQQEIADAIVGCLQVEIEAAEQRRALMRTGDSLDAWSAYHRGVWHMNKFNAEDFDKAESMFGRALELRPDDARVFAGLSFIAFQRAFLRIDPDFDGSMRKAEQLAARSIEIDPRETLGHWAMGRTLLMYREYDQSIEELETAIDLNPNFAGAHFSLSRSCFASGKSERGIAATDTARRLSPYDPNLFAMLSVRANCLVQMGKVDEAVDWVVRAARQPNAHHHIQAIAAYCTALAGRMDLAARYKERLLAERPDYGMEDFLLAFPLKEADHVELVRTGLRKAGIKA